MVQTSIASQIETEKSKLDRIQEARTVKWIGYTRALEVLDLMDDLITHPKIHRMPNLMLIGESNNGKTMIINRFQELNSSEIDMDGVTQLPCVVVECPPTPDEGRLYNAILSKLYVPHKAHAHIDQKRDQVIGVLKNIGLKILILDEIHNVLSGVPTKQRQMLNAIKYLGNTLQIPIVVAGTIDALRAMVTDPQLANRFDRFILEPWPLDKEFIRLIASFERSLPLLKPSNLTSKELATKIYMMSEGIIGEIYNLLSDATIAAIQSGDEQITLKTLEGIRWIKPSRRKAVR